jgi:oxygen-dependent protoporphyrinogen oxidase
MSEYQDTTIVGGGIAGLAAAYYLQRAHPAREIRILEASNHLGGKIITARDAGFIIEGGPDAFLASKPQGMTLATELGIADELVGSVAETRRTYVVRDGELLPMPEGLSGLIPARIEPVMESALFTEEGKRRFLAEERTPPGETAGDESLTSFMERRFGSEVYRRLIEPLMSGIYAGDGEELSTEATFPQLRAMERDKGSILRVLRSQPAPAEQQRPPGFLTPRAGMDRLPAALAAALRDVEIVCETAVQRVERVSGGFRLGLQDGTTLTASSVLVAAPAWAASEFLSSLDADLSHVLASIPHVSTATISLGFDSSTVPNALHGHGYIVPRAEGLPVLACTWMSSKYPERAPAGKVLLRCFVGRRGQEESLCGTDADLVQLAREELRTRLGIGSAPEVARVFRWPKGMPQYTMGHLERVATIDRIVGAIGGLAVAGAAYRGVGIPDCIASAQSAIHSLHSPAD